MILIQVLGKIYRQAHVGLRRAAGAHNGREILSERLAAKLSRTLHICGTLGSLKGTRFYSSQFGRFFPTVRITTVAHYLPYLFNFTRGVVSPTVLSQACSQAVSVSECALGEVLIQVIHFRTYFPCTNTVLVTDGPEQLSYVSDWLAGSTCSNGLNP